MDKSELSNIIKQKIISKGFHAVGIANALELNGFENKLNQWILSGYHAEMQFLERNREKRGDVSKLLPGSKSVILMLASYKPSENIDLKNPQIAKYAYGLDYHVILKQKMLEIWNEIKEITPELDGRIFTDSAPLYERGYAYEAGLGWLGKNSCLINPHLGSMVLICEMVTNLELEYDQAFNKIGCGSCTRCIDACPTQAIVEPGLIDSRKCISYLTIENKGEIPENLASKITNQLFGCDICQDVCPWNQKVKPVKIFEEFRLNPQINQTLTEWKQMDEMFFRRQFKNSAISRCSWESFQRNLKVISDSGKLQN